ncbi:MAG: hypothetical protein RL377_1378 [Bacteroidota bacterium]|jgi:uncharacterized protein (TIGR01777 family)
MQTVLITGGTGMVGQSLTDSLVEQGYEVIVLTRSPRKSSRLHVSFAKWDIDQNYIDPQALEEANIIVHLAGESVATKRWTEKRKQEILDSRVKSGLLLTNALKTMKHQVHTFIGASAIGWYGPDNVRSIKDGFVETDTVDHSYLGDTCKAWEESVASIAALGIRQVTLRIGIVLNKRGGALLEFMKPARLAVAAILGDGRQIVSWIHQQDLTAIVLFAIRQPEIKGVYNAVAPEPISNENLTIQIASKYYSWFIKVHVPVWVLKIMLGEMSIEVLKSAKVSSQKLQNAQFQFQFPTISAALENLI